MPNVKSILQNGNRFNVAAIKYLNNYMKWFKWFKIFRTDKEPLYV